MLQSTISAEGALALGPIGLLGEHGTALAELVADARRYLDQDPALTRLCLERMAEIFAPACAAADRKATLLPTLPGGDGAACGIRKGGLAAWQLRRVADHIDAHLAQSIPIEALAMVSRLSNGHFCRAFKVSVGETPHAFIIRQRVRRAQILMLETGDTLSQIACACGLTDQAHLTRLFRRFVGATPLVWRRTWRTDH